MPMTVMELNATLLRELSSIATNEDLLKKAIRYIRSIKKEQREQTLAGETLIPYTMEELNARIDSFEAELSRGEQGLPLEEFNAEIRQKYPWL